MRAIKNREYFIDQLNKLIKEIRIETKDAIYYLAKLVEIHDHSTGKHLERIEHYTRTLATEYYKKFGEVDKYITTEYVEDLAVSSVLHDIGKVAVSDTILLKPGKLTKDEFDIIKQHTEIVGEALKSFKGKKDFLALGREIAMAHHEKWDGTGYPKGLKGKAIPLSARIISICDVYDALVSDRPYKKAIPHDKAVKIIKNESGKSFDPVITELFLKIHHKFDDIRKKFDTDD
jgi:response regulator RpfG family c-di-GMP phosphodiesterase